VYSQPVRYPFQEGDGLDLAAGNDLRDRGLLLSGGVCEPGLAYTGIAQDAEHRCDVAVREGVPCGCAGQQVGQLSHWHPPSL
jgi:hypothetical protein